MRSSSTACAPRAHCSLPHDRDLAEKVAKLYRVATGRSLLQWQMEVLADWTALEPDGTFTHKRCGLSVPRQNGKSVGAIAWVAYLAAVMGYGVLWSEHNYSTTVEMLGRFREIFGSRPDDPSAPRSGLNQLVSRVNSKTAQEAIFFEGGGRIHFATRTKSTALGYSFDVVVFDEAQELDDAHVQAIMPTMNAAEHKNPQTIYLGTPPRAGSVHGAAFAKQRAEALDGDAWGLTWTEYGIDRVPDPSDRSCWFATNPSLGTVSNDTSLRSAASSLTPLAFAQDCLGYWLPSVSAASVLGVDDWGACLVSDEESAAIDGIQAFGVKFSPDGLTYALSGAVRQDEGPTLVQLLDVSDATHGCGRLAQWLLDRSDDAALVAVDGKSGASALVRLLTDGGMPTRAVVDCSPAQAQAAASMLVDSVRSRSVVHAASPALDESATGSVRREIGRNGGFGFGDGAECISAPVESAALALWAARTTRRDPRRRQVAW